MPQTRFKFCYLSTIKKLFIALAISLSSFNYLSATEVTASNIVTIPPQKQRDLWRQAIASPVDNYHYYIAYTNGQIYLADARQSISSVLVNTASFIDKNAFIELTGFALHPSFKHREQTGFLTFYTAHIERHNSQLNKKRLPKKQEASPLVDVVVTEWQLSKESYQEAKPSRELLRVSSPSSTQKMTKLAFNPYVKSWQDNFGFLYVAINNMPTKNPQAIYAGSILRINTSKFGLKPYTIPKDNPFISQNNIDNEIAVITASHVIDINWAKGEGTDLVISTSNRQQVLVYPAKLGDDWRAKKPSPLYAREKSNNVLPGMFYFGRNLNWLWQHYFSIKPSNGGWQMSATSGLLTKIGTGINTRQWPVNDPQLNQEPELSLFPDHQGEPLAFAPASGKLYRLFVINEQLDNAKTNESEQVNASSNDNILIIATVFVLLLSTPMVYLVIRRIRQKQQSIRHQFTRLEFSNKNEQVKIYRPRQTKPSIELTVTEIIESSVYLNDIDLATINATKVFDNGVQTSIEDALAREYRHKMVDNKIRKIEVSIKTKTNKEHIVCLYLRKGNTRITKNAYDDSLLFLFDWCWFISQKLHPNANIIRKLKLPVEPITPVPQKPCSAPKAATIASESRPSPETVIQQPTTGEQTLKSANEKTSIDQDTELVKALEKLVKLKEQGMLTEAEFNQAKTKLLNDLVQN